MVTTGGPTAPSAASRGGAAVRWLQQLLLILRGGDTPARARHGSAGKGGGVAAATRLARSWRPSFRLLCLFLTALAGVLFLFFAIRGLSNHLAVSSADAVSWNLPSEGFSVVINTWERDELLKRVVAHYSGCAGVSAIHVVWSKPNQPPSALERPLRRLMMNSEQNAGSRRAPELIFDVNNGTSLNNRFRDVAGLSSEAVFSVDDDVVVPCRSVELAYRVWLSAPSAMVGFVPRLHLLDTPRPGGITQYKYGGWKSVWWTGTYSMVLTKAAFLHKRFLNLYTHQMTAAIRDYVTTNRNCDDIAMSFLVANTTGAPPIWVKGRVIELATKGISSLRGHDARRNKCLNAFATIYGRMPLVASHIKAVDSRRSWIW